MLVYNYHAESHDISLGMTSYRHVYPSIQARESIIAPFKLSIVIVSAMERAQDQKKVESTIM